MPPTQVPPITGPVVVERESQARPVPQLPQVADWRQALTLTQNRHAEILHREEVVKARSPISEMGKHARESALQRLGEEKTLLKSLIDFYKTSIEEVSKESTELSQLEQLAAGGNGR